MDETHDRYEALAVGHVLGGLPPAVAADFRHHLTGCRDCRLRVAELRSIADDLAAAEREERAEARVRTEVVPQTAEVAPHRDVDPRGPALTSRHLGLGGLVIILVATGLAFWNLHLRTQVATLTGVAEQQAETLAGLASGVPVVTEFSGEGHGAVVVDGERVTFSIAGLAPLDDGERYVVWLTGTDEGDRPVVTAGTGHLVGSVDDLGASQLLVTVETAAPASGTPAGRVLVRADLEAPTE